jgi:transposase-like protein
MDETYVKVRGQWEYLYRVADKAGKTVDFRLRAHRDKGCRPSLFRESHRPERRAGDHHDG